MTIELIQSQFIKPYPQPSLNGELGLTSEDIASSVGMQHQHFKRTIRQAGYLDLIRSVGFNFVQLWTKTGRRGRPKELWVFPLETAKIILAQSRTKIGCAYVVFLIKCERALHVAVEALQIERNRVTKLLEEREQLLARQRVSNRHRIAIMVTQRTLFGEETIIEQRRKYLDDMTPQERRQWQSLHAQRVAKGAIQSSVALAEFKKDPKPALAPWDAPEKLTDG